MIDGVGVFELATVEHLTDVVHLHGVGGFRMGALGIAHHFVLQAGRGGRDAGRPGIGDEEGFAFAAVLRGERQLPRGAFFAQLLGETLADLVGLYGVEEWLFARVGAAQGLHYDIDVDFVFYGGEVFGKVEADHVAPALFIGGERGVRGGRFLGA